MALATQEHLLSLGVITESHGLPLASYIAKAEHKVLSLLKKDWWTNWCQQQPQYRNQQLNPTLLVIDEWQDIIANYALAYIILPKLSTVEWATEIASAHQNFEDGYRTRIEFGFTYDPLKQQSVDPAELADVDYLRMR
jgi:hypothetical protein